MLPAGSVLAIAGAGIMAILVLSVGRLMLLTAFSASFTPHNPISQGVGEPGVIQSGSSILFNFSAIAFSQVVTVLRVAVNYLTARTTFTPIHCAMAFRAG